MNIIDIDKFIGRISDLLGDCYSSKSKKEFLNNCRKIVDTSLKFKTIVNDKAFWSALEELVVSYEEKVIKIEKPSISISMDSDTVHVNAEYSDSKGPVLVICGELHFNPRNDCLECRKVTERALSDEVHEIKSEEHIYYEGIEFKNYEGHCSYNTQVTSDYGHGNMIPHFFITDYGYLKNPYYTFDDTVVRSKGTDSLGVYQEVRKKKDDYCDIEEIFLYRQDTKTPSIKSAPGWEPEDITAKSRTHTYAAEKSIKDMCKLMSDEQLDLSTTASLYVSFGQT